MEANEILKLQIEVDFWCMFIFFSECKFLICFKGNKTVQF